MSDELLPYYNQELKFVQELAAEFAELHPDAAAALRVSAGNVDDPHVERLIQAFALVSARIRFKIDDDFPELTDSLLNHLYPHYLAPLPSMAMVQMTPSPDLDGCYTLETGSEIETEAVRGTKCRYRTTTPVALWPLEVRSASLSGLPFEAPASPVARERGAVGVVRITLGLCNPNVGFAELANAWEATGAHALRFYINGRGQRSLSFPLYELLFNNTVAIAIATDTKDVTPVFLEPSSLLPVGFDDGEGMLPYGARSFLGYRLLTEYFAFPEKFLFFDVADVPARALARGNRTLELFLYLKQSDPDLERAVGAETFALHCTPIVNLFQHHAEPVPLNHAQSDYLVQSDRRRANAYEIYAVESVSASESGRQVALKPFFAINHGDQPDVPGPFWQAIRRPAQGTKPGTEVFLSVVDLEFDPAARAGWVLSVDTTCLNRDLPRDIPFGGGRPRLNLAEGAAEVAELSCLTQPTRTRRISARNGARWRLLSHLSLNHLSLLDGNDQEAGGEALRELLRLYDTQDSDATRKSIDAIRKIWHERGLARVPFAEHGAFCPGVDVHVEFDRSGFPGGSPYLLAAVLDRFFGAYCSLNAFSRLTAWVTGQEDSLKKWQPRAGDRILL